MRASLPRLREISSAGFPAGQKYDDPGEPTFGQYWTGLYRRAQYDFWGTAKEAVRDFFAFPEENE